MLTQMNELHLISMMDIPKGLSEAADKFKDKYLEALTDDFANGVSSIDGFITIVGRKAV
jgi:hypothetical protein